MAGYSVFSLVIIFSEYTSQQNSEICLTNMPISLWANKNCISLSIANYSLFLFRSQCVNITLRAHLQFKEIMTGVVDQYSANPTLKMVLTLYLYAVIAVLQLCISLI